MFGDLKKLNQDASLRSAAREASERLDAGDTIAQSLAAAQAPVFTPSPARASIGYKMTLADARDRVIEVALLWQESEDIVNPNPNYHRTVRILLAKRCREYRTIRDTP